MCVGTCKAEGMVGTLAHMALEFVHIFDDCIIMSVHSLKLIQISFLLTCNLHLNAIAAIAANHTPCKDGPQTFLPRQPANCYLLPSQFHSSYHLHAFPGLGYVIEHCDLMS